MTILRYKYDCRQSWSIIFGRLLLAWLEDKVQDTRPDLIITNPTYLGPDGATFAHTECVIEVAAREAT